MQFFKPIFSNNLRFFQVLYCKILIIFYNPIWKSKIFLNMWDILKKIISKTNVINHLKHFKEHFSLYLFTFPLSSTSSGIHWFSAFTFRFGLHPRIQTVTPTCPCGTTAPPRRGSRTWPSRRRGRPVSRSFSTTDHTSRLKWLKGIFWWQVKFKCIYSSTVISRLTTPSVFPNCI